MGLVIFLKASRSIGHCVTPTSVRERDFLVLNSETDVPQSFSHLRQTSQGSASLYFVSQINTWYTSVPEIPRSVPL